MTLHFPVTTSFWRGVWDFSRKWPQQQLRRACDWAPTRAADTSVHNPTCELCVHYKATLLRLGKLARFTR
jgi:hypothetical protein